ncbi:MAG: bifunctional diaminohydroxyphosphoribosylaminopyrimidine deaminase/5-amino-6-(5-phosphoribosylamino)uracil reductase RibD [Actinomycetota bacterium]|nr:bifunctional diaminohydroxyphosphoribosylaminopyrimidine deaminase/5-amino-6-(5-phosphoribosylamino)uracil reductase RibD [Actinomycetota bacterium]
MTDQSIEHLTRTSMDRLGTEHDSAHLRRALELAEGGRGRVSPNPLVGAVLVGEGGEQISEGFHAELGGLHAERAAIADARERGNDPAGATLYVTLEPCAHSGRQPPCTEAILEAEISRVLYASEDPTEKASGRGPGILRDGGIEVELSQGSEAAAVRLLNQPFRKLARTGRPLVTYKAAMTLDGRVAAPGGDSRWISATESRQLVHTWRSQSDAVAVGIGTALADDPLLTARSAGPDGDERPRESGPAVRVVFDSQARLPLGSALVQSVEEAALIVVCAPEAPSARRDALEAAGAEVVVAAGADSPARLGAALDELGRRQISDLLLEGGPTIAGALFDAGEFDQVRLFIAPVLLGAGNARAVLEGKGAQRIAEGLRPLATEHQAIGEDLLITARLREW